MEEDSTQLHSIKLQQKDNLTYSTNVCVSHNFFSVILRVLALMVHMKNEQNNENSNKVSPFS